MKNSVIRDLFYGVRGFNETMKVPKINKERANKMCEMERKLKNQLSSKQFDLHEKFVKLIDDEYADEIDFYFVEGFKLGFLIAVECFEDN